MRRIPAGATARITMKLFQSADHVTPQTGATVAVVISKNGGAFANPAAGATNATEISNGWYYVDLGAGDTGTAGDLIVRGTATSSDPTEQVLHVVNANNGGLAALPNAAAEAAGGLFTRGSGAGQINQPANGLVDVNVTRFGGTAGTFAAGVPEVKTQSITNGAIGSATFAAGAIDATAIATDAIGADELAASAISEIQAGLALAASILDASGIRTAVGLGSANLDSQLSTINGKLPALVGGRVDASVGAMQANTVTASAVATDAVTEFQSGLATASALSTVDGKVDAIGAKTTNLPSDPADASVIAARFDTLDAAVAVVDGVADGIAAKTVNLPSDPADQSLIIAATDALATLIGDVPTNAELATALASADDAVLTAIAALSIPTANDNADALLDRANGIETGRTVRQMGRILLAALAGKASGMGTTTGRFRDQADTKDRIVVTQDADGNRSALTLDLT